jgi:hypothetical protein
MEICQREGSKNAKTIISALVSLVWTVPSTAQVTEQLAKPAVARDQVIPVPKPEQRQEDSQSTQKTEESLLNRLASSGRTGIEMIPTFVVRAKDADGNPVFLMLSPDSNLEWQITPLDGEDDSSTSSPEQEPPSVAFVQKECSDLFSRRCMAPCAI